jgi:hypothetical protein
MDTAPPPRSRAAIHDRSIGDRAAELLDSSFVRHDLVELFLDSRGPAGGPRIRVHDHLSYARLPARHQDIFGAGDRAAVRRRADLSFRVRVRLCFFVTGQVRRAAGCDYRA